MPPVGRVGGQAYSSNGSILTARSAPVPVQPKTPPAVRAQQTYSASSNLWATLTPSQKSAWQALSPAPSHGYSRFLGANQYMLTWGLPTVTDLPVTWDTHGAGVTTSFLADGSSAWIEYLMPSPPIITPPCNLRLYWTPNTVFQTVRGGGGIGVRPVNMPTLPTKKYEYLGSWGPFPMASTGTIDISSLVYNRLGYYPMNAQINVPTVDKSTWFFVSTRQYMDFWDSGYVGIKGHSALSAPAARLVGFGGGLG